ncbi:hypothetical protein Mmc1_2351 [Magnetococcus marinus MC-1]|uniref:FixH family protein n=1 Tax=Magnetococcus marinus (strain ATCC BAA-1437 / JCM 17883 / MC-1) TaxID=156889 RepID=A0LA58_MAGMM|nr:FixH family protein [Magnetococcus marinus]ABK44851.1 hypothetical protein Mmc1_2351 [Magnetococcus marinus MC-1]
MSHTEEKLPWYAGGWPWAIAGVVMAVAVIGVNFYMWYSGSQSATGLVIEGRFKKGMTYDKEMEQYKNQVALGWKITQDSSQLMLNQERPLTITVLDKTDQPIQGAHVQGSLIRPIGAGSDVNFMLAESSPGVYVGLVTPHLIGSWYVQATITRGDELYVYKKRIQVVR